MAEKNTVSLCMIVKNEEIILEKCLERIYKITDEIIIVDTGSTDNTVSIAKKYTDKVYFFKWINDFSAARNFCSSFATSKYILRLDADTILDSDIEELITLKDNAFDQSNLVFLKLNIVDQEVQFPHYFFYTRKDFHWESPIHNKLVPNKPNFTVKTKYYDNVVIGHYKDPIIKKHRYIQTHDMLEQVLLDDANNPYHLFGFAGSLMIKKDFNKAIQTFYKYLQNSQMELEEKKMIAIENIIYCYLELGEINKAQEIAKEYIHLYKFPRYKLIYADICALQDLKSAENHYKEFLIQKEELKESIFTYYHERYEVHPYNMLSKINMEKQDYKSAIKYLKIVIKNTRIPATKQTALDTIKNIKN